VTGDLGTLRFEVRDSIAVVTLDRPEVHNAFNRTMQEELQSVWQDVAADDGVRVIVLTGAGDRAFCSGIDREEAIGDGPSSGPPDPFELDDPGRRLGPKTNGVWKPIIAAVNGMACGGAFYLLGESDIVIAAEEATFFDPHVTYGMASAYESIHMLPRMPIGELLRMQLLGNHERMSAHRAHQIGLVSDVVPAGELLEAAMVVARAIASQPPLAVQATVRAIWGALDLPHSQAVASAYGYVRLGNTAESIRDGQESFRSGERPRWRLR
jgi:enoyl-CoA hydratase/carnithine racemase